MQTSIQPPRPTADERPETTAPDQGGSRLRTVTGNRFPRNCSCGCGREIPRDTSVRYVVDFGARKPYPTYLSEHSPDFGSYRGRRWGAANATTLPRFVRASSLVSEPQAQESLEPPTVSPDVAHVEPDASPAPEAGRPWASGQLVFNAGSFESARSGFAEYAKEGETSQQLRARVNRVILEDLEQKVRALRALHEKLRGATAGPSFADVVARSRPL
jgi:hypothetical protein